MKIVRAVQTCAACPSQWDAWTDDDTQLYLRYRFGWGTVMVGGARAWSVGDGHAPDLIHFQHGDELDGEITLEAFCQLAGIELALVDR